jgi:glycosyltransferase involved in cell wall biosynthesis
MDIRNIACYSYSLGGEDYLAHLRLIGPLKRAGINLINGIEDGQIVVSRVSEGDIVIIQREVPQEFAQYREILALAHREHKPVVFDLDDLLLCLPESHPDRKSAVFGPSLLPMFQMMMEADLVSVSTPKLSEYASNFNKNVAVLPNYFDDDLWHLREPVNNPSDGRVLTIGYMGGNSHTPDLEFILPVLVDLIKQYPQKIGFQFWGVRPPEALLSFPQVKWTPFQPLSYIAFSSFFQSQAADIFISPLTDNLFNRCKSSIKFFEYSALGAPGVYSDLETYSGIVNHGSNGFLASSPEEWRKCIQELIENDELRFSQARKAQDTIREKWLLSQNADHWKEVLQNIIVRERSDTEYGKLLGNTLTAINTQLFDAHKKKEAQVNGLKADIADRENTIQEVWGEVAERERNIQAISAEVANRDQIIRALSTQMNGLKADVADRERIIQEVWGEVAKRDQNIQVLSATLADIYRSKAWRLILLLREIRLKLIPPGSLGARMLHKVWRAVSIIKNQGIRGLLHRIKNKPVAVVPESPAASSVESFSVAIRDGLPCPMPAISVVILKSCGSGLPEINEKDVLEWVSKQTISGMEVVSWDGGFGKATLLSGKKHTWDAPGLEELFHGLSGRYLCIASTDLLQRPPVYLEANLVALESEALAFTVNTMGKSDWLSTALEGGKLPGSSTTPYLRLIIRKECARDDFAVDISQWMAGKPEKPMISGKVIIHTTAYPDTGDILLVETPLVGFHDLSINGNYIYVRSNAQIPWLPMEQVVHPVNTVMPEGTISSRLPTVIIYQPSLAVGGAERLALELGHYLQDQVRSIVVTNEGMDASLGTTADAYHRWIPYTYTAADFLAPSLNFSFLCYLIERFHVDAFYIANGSITIYDLLGELRRKYPGLRIVNQVYDHQVGWINWYNPTVVSAINGHISANPNISRAYAERGVTQERIHFVEHAINLGELDPAKYPPERCNQIREELGIPVDKKLVTFCARIHPQKRPVDFIELARRFGSEPGIHFLMVGDGPLSTIVEEQAAKAELKNFTRCKFYMPVSDIYAITDVLVLPSEFEAMPLVILEALAMGKPVVATDVGHIRDVVEMSHGGVVVPNIGDVAALRQGVLKVLSEPVDPVFMRTTIEKRFGLDNIAHQYKQVWLGEKHA